jgi:hypothetical protein
VKKNRATAVSAVTYLIISAAAFSSACPTTANCQTPGQIGSGSNIPNTFESLESLVTSEPTNLNTGVSREARFLKLLQNLATEHSPNSYSSSNQISLNEMIQSGANEYELTPLTATENRKIGEVIIAAALSNGFNFADTTLSELNSIGITVDSRYIQLNKDLVKIQASTMQGTAQGMGELNKAQLKKVIQDLSQMSPEERLSSFIATSLGNSAIQSLYTSEKLTPELEASVIQLTLSVGQSLANLMILDLYLSNIYDVEPSALYIKLKESLMQKALELIESGSASVNANHLDRVTACFALESIFEIGKINSSEANQDIAINGLSGSQTSARAGAGTGSSTTGIGSGAGTGFNLNSEKIQNFLVQVKKWTELAKGQDTYCSFEERSKIAGSTKVTEGKLADLVLILQKKAASGLIQNSQNALLGLAPSFDNSKLEKICNLRALKSNIASEFRTFVSSNRNQGVTTYAGGQTLLNGGTTCTYSLAIHPKKRTGKHQKLELEPQKLELRIEVMTGKLQTLSTIEETGTLSEIQSAITTLTK